MTTARMQEGRAVKMKPWEDRFTSQRRIKRGTDKPSATVPVLTSISPSSGTAGTQYTVTCTGTGYTVDSVVTANKKDLPTTYVSATSITCKYTPPSAGAKSFLVRNVEKFSTTPRTFTAS